MWLLAYALALLALGYLIWFIYGIFWDKTEAGKKWKEVQDEAAGD